MNESKQVWIRAQHCKRLVQRMQRLDLSSRSDIKQIIQKAFEARPMSVSIQFELENPVSIPVLTITEQQVQAAIKNIMSEYLYCCYRR